ncbi:MAG: T9SS type A sorting domain-containing protein [Chitinophagaceae bacterium]
MKKIFLTCLLFAAYSGAKAQLCNNALDTLYSLNSITGSGSGQIIAVDVNNAGTKLIGAPATASDNANGLGFSKITGKFYFFNQAGNGVTNFVSYLPNSGTKVILTNPPLLPTTQKIRSGCVTKDGTGYYTIYPGATTAQGFAQTQPAFYYYNIGAATWTLITQNFKDVSGSVVTPIKALNSGDMAFDGNDNLWMLCSTGAGYALYKINAPLPTTALAPAGFITVDTMIPQTVPPGAVSFTGLAFNSAGSLFLSTGSYTTAPGVAGNNQLYRLASLSGTLTTIGTLTNGFGDDLTSCSYPVAVLSSNWVDFNARYADDKINLTWKVNEESVTEGYLIEYSTDGEHWQQLTYLNRQNALNDLKEYSYVHSGYQAGRNFYRVIEKFASGKKSISDIKAVDTRNDIKMHLGPNPTKDILYFYNKNTSSKQLAQVFDKSGKMVLATFVAQGQQSLDVAGLPKGIYILKLSASDIDDRSKGYQFVKW